MWLIQNFCLLWGNLTWEDCSIFIQEILVGLVVLDGRNSTKFYCILWSRHIWVHPLAMNQDGEKLFLCCRCDLNLQKLERAIRFGGWPQEPSWDGHTFKRSLETLNHSVWPIAALNLQRPIFFIDEPIITMLEKCKTKRAGGRVIFSPQVCAGTCEPLVSQERCTCGTKWRMETLRTDRQHCCNSARICDLQQMNLSPTTNSLLLSALMVRTHYLFHRARQASSCDQAKWKVLIMQTREPEEVCCNPMRTSLNKVMSMSWQLMDIVFPACTIAYDGSKITHSLNVESAW